MPAYANPGTSGLGGVSLWDLFYQDNPQAAYYRHLNRSLGGVGLGDTGRDDWYQRQFGRQYQSYLGALPELGQETTFLDYLQRNGDSLEQRFRGLSPQQRGERPGAYQGRVRFVGLGAQ